MRWSAEQFERYQARRQGPTPSSTPARRARRQPRPQRAEPSETQAHIAIVAHIRRRGVPGVIAWHTPNGGLRSKSEASKLAAMGVVAGVPDLLLLHDGRLYGLELKTSTGRTSAEQRATMRALEAAGALTATAYGQDAALTILTAWGLLRPANNQCAASELKKKIDGTVASR